MLRAAMEGFRARPGEVLGRRYRLEGLLGQGGMGEVWEATHLVLGRQVALKILKPRFAQMGEVLVRFKREAQVMASIAHPNMVEVLDFVCQPGQPAYLVMELLAGQSLESALAERGRLAWPVAVRVALDVLSALGAAHASGVVHRDVKPANIWLEGDLNEPRVKVLDFGVAQIADEGGPKLTQTNTTVGTPQYLPPEQIAGSRVDARADLWALGATLYETLAGRPAFIGGDFAALVGAILTSEPPRLETLLPGLPAALVQTVHAALSKQPQGRPASAEAMAAPLRELFGGIARDHTDDAFAATIALTETAPVSPPSFGYDATIAAAAGSRQPPAVGAIDSSPRLPQTRHQAPAPAPAKRHFGRAVILKASPGHVLGGAPPIQEAPRPAASPQSPQHVPLSLADDEPVVLPQRATGRWLLAGVGFVLLGGLVLLGVIIVGRRTPTPDPVAEHQAPSAQDSVLPAASAPVAPAAPDAGEPAAPDASHPSIHAQAPTTAPTTAPTAAVNGPTAPRASHVGAQRPADVVDGGSTGVSTPHSPLVHFDTPIDASATTVAHAPNASAMTAVGVTAASDVPDAASPRVDPPRPRRSSASVTQQPVVATGRASRLRRMAIGGSYDGYAARAHIGAAQAAADRCVRRMHPPTGTAEYRVTVPPDGDVQSVTGGDPTVARCLERAFGIIQWSAPPGGAAQFVTVTYEALP